MTVIVTGGAAGLAAGGVLVGDGVGAGGRVGGELSEANVEPVWLRRGGRCIGSGLGGRNRRLRLFSLYGRLLGQADYQFVAADAGPDGLELLDEVLAGSIAAGLDESHGFGPRLLGRRLAHLREQLPHVGHFFVGSAKHEAITLDVGRHAESLVRVFLFVVVASAAAKEEVAAAVVVVVLFLLAEHELLDRHRGQVGSDATEADDVKLAAFTVELRDQALNLGVIGGAGLHPQALAAAVVRVRSTDRDRRSLRASSRTARDRAFPVDTF